MVFLLETAPQQSLQEQYRAGHGRSVAGVSDCRREDGRDGAEPDIRGARHSRPADGRVNGIQNTIREADRRGLVHAGIGNRDARSRADIVIVYQHNHVFDTRSFSTIFTEGIERMADLSKPFGAKIRISSGTAAIVVK
jgi:hypothetical protein